ncbi:hypothetical protein WG29040_20805 [Pseudomonas sp. PAMC 29040]|nr:hypothetical protein [Pseudomonas sp. TMW22089]NBG89741.1 hypothetical protein [Pseudomonas sp. 9.1(2019)]RUT32281.1 hypothetical protein WG29040_20805 [Pseudomonas sp. PAMC 29040]
MLLSPDWEGYTGKTFVTGAINKNKKPAINNKNRARNYFWGSFGSPCSFCNSEKTSSQALLQASCSYFHLLLAASLARAAQLPTPSPD